MSVEVAITATLFVIFTILGFDMLTVAFGYSILDSAARDAARAAASTGNKADGLIAAQQAVLSHRTDGYFVMQPTVSELIPADFVYDTPAQGSPFVTVTTRSQLRIQTPVSFFGAYLANGVFPVARSYTFPILGVPFVPNPGAGAASPPLTVASVPPTPPSKTTTSTATTTTNKSSSSSTGTKTATTSSKTTTASKTTAQQPPKQSTATAAVGPSSPQSQKPQANSSSSSSSSTSSAQPPVLAPSAG
jgi:hypothetical protein